MANSITKKIGFKYYNSMFINLYSKDNPILNSDDYCYFLFNNTTDLHMPMIGYGKIIKDTFVEGMHKFYWIELQEVLEENPILEKFLYGKSTLMYNIKGATIAQSSKAQMFVPDMPKDILEENVFKVENFFVRPTIEAITILQKEYISVIRQNTLNDLRDMNDFLKDYTPEE